MTFMCIIVVSHILHVPPNPPNFANSVLYTHARYSQFHTERGGGHKNASLKSEILEWCSKTIWHEKLFVSSKITPPYSAPFLPRVFTYPTYSSPAPSTATVLIGLSRQFFVLQGYEALVLVPTRGWSSQLARYSAPTKTTGWFGCRLVRSD